MNSVKHGFEKQQTFIFSAELFKTFEDIVKTAWTCDKKSLKFEIFSDTKKIQTPTSFDVPQSDICGL